MKLDRADSQDIISDHVPSTTASAGGFASLPSAVRPLRASLEDLDDHIAHRAALVSEARQLAEHDDVRPEVLQEASRLAHGGSGDVKPEWFEPIFEKALSKYDKLKEDMVAEPASQDELLEQIRVSWMQNSLADSLRSRMTPFCANARRTLASRSANAVFKRWTWRTGSGVRLWTMPKRATSSTMTLPPCFISLRRNARSS